MNINVKSVKVFLKYSRALMINLPRSAKSVEEDLKSSSLFPLFI